jgi:hypothetical protein
MGANRKVIGAKCFVSDVKYLPSCVVLSVQPLVQDIICNVESTDAEEHFNIHLVRENIYGLFHIWQKSKFR